MSHDAIERSKKTRGSEEVEVHYTLTRIVIPPCEVCLLVCPCVLLEPCPLKPLKDQARSFMPSLVKAKSYTN